MKSRHVIDRGFGLESKGLCLCLGIVNKGFGLTVLVHCMVKVRGTSKHSTHLYSLLLFSKYMDNGQYSVTKKVNIMKYLGTMGHDDEISSLNKRFTCV